MQITNIKQVTEELGLYGNFEITKGLLDKVELLTSPNCQSVKFSRRKSGRRLDTLSLIKSKRLAGIPAKDIKEGFVYIMSNPAWKGYYKIGYSLEPRDRLIQAQVFSPFGDYKIEGYYISSNAREMESFIHNKLSKFHVRGEWFNVKLDNLRKLIKRNKLIIE